MTTKRRGYLVRFADWDEYYLAGIDRRKPIGESKPVVLPDAVAETFADPLFGYRTRYVMVRNGEVIGRGPC